MNEDDLKLHIVATMIALACMLAVMCCSCRPAAETVYVNRTDTVYRTNSRTDSVFVHDSVHLHDYAVGETVYSTKTVFRDRLRYRDRTDTAYISRTDTVFKETVIEKGKRQGLLAKCKTGAEIGIGALLLLALLSIIIKVKTRI